MALWRSYVTHWFERRWYDGVPPNAVLRGLSFCVTGWVRNKRQRFLNAMTACDPSQRPKSVSIPIVIVGNLAVGGAGKTPLTLALIEAFRRAGLRPGVISRGYGRASNDLHRVMATDLPEDSGDEPLLIAKRSGVPVAVAAKRVDAARLLAESGEVDVLIADDGLQHYQLARDIEILVVDGQRRFGNGLVLPAGPLREPLERVATCDYVVVNGGQAQGDEVQMRLKLTQAKSLLSEVSLALSDLVRTPVHAVAGIGNPARFFDALRAEGLEVIEHAFPDHHVFSPEDLKFDDGFPIVMTEKDAVKCMTFAQERMFMVPVDAHLPEEFFEQLVARVKGISAT